LTCDDTIHPQTGGWSYSIHDHRISRFVCLDRVSCSDSLELRRIDDSTYCIRHGSTNHNDTVRILLRGRDHLEIVRDVNDPPEVKDHYTRSHGAVPCR
jgi:hypothetical protein